MLQWLPGWVRRAPSAAPQKFGGEAPPFEAFGKYPADPDGFPLVDPLRLIAHQEELIKAIRRSARFTDASRWEALFHDAIVRYANFVHLLPASESDHHRGVGGLFRHGLEVGHKSILLGYSHAQDMSNFPSHNRMLEERWSYACFIAGLCHDLGKAVSDMTVTDVTGGLQWSPYTETLVDWARRHDIKRYFIHYRPNRHKRHAAFSVKVSHHIIRKEGDLFLSDVSDQLMQDVTDAIMGSTSSLASIVRYVTQADGLSCEEDRKRNPLMDIAAAGHTAAAPAHKYLYDAIRNCVNDRVWKPNDPSGPLFIINRSAYLIWPRAVPEILARVGVQRGVPTSHMTIAEMLEERGLIVQYNPDAHNVHTYWSILPEPLETKGITRPLKAICLDKASRFFDVEPPSVAAKIYDPVAASRIPANATRIEIEPRANFQAITPRRGIAETEGAADAGVPLTPPAILAPQPPPGIPAEQLAANPSSIRSAAAPIAPGYMPGSKTEAANHQPPEPDAASSISDDALAGILGAPVSSEPPTFIDFDLLSKTPTRPSAPPSSKQDTRRNTAQLSQPRAVAQPNNVMEHQMFFQRSEHPIGVTLLSLIQRLIEDPDRPEHTLMARHKDLLVLQYPEGVSDLGLQPKTIVEALRSADWLTHELTLPPIKDDVVFPRAVVLSRDISRRLFALLHGIDIQRSAPTADRLKIAVKAMRGIVAPPTRLTSQGAQPIEEPLQSRPKETPARAVGRAPAPQVIDVTDAIPEAPPPPIIVEEVVMAATSSEPSPPDELSDREKTDAGHGTTTSDHPVMGRKGLMRLLRRIHGENPQLFTKKGKRYIAPAELLCARLVENTTAKLTEAEVLEMLSAIPEVMRMEENGGAWLSFPQAQLTQGAK